MSKRHPAKGNSDPKGEVFALIGPLGAGKTTYVREWIRARVPRVARRVVSPTFILQATYHLPKGSVHHLDWYRLNSESDVLGLGWEDILSEPALAIFVEWADKFPKLLPKRHTVIRFRYGRRPDERKITIRRVGGRA